MIPGLGRVFRLESPSLGILGKVQIHPLFILLFVLACGVGLWREMVVLFILVILHELGHAAAAHALGYEVESVSLLPFGGVARMAYGNLGFLPQHEALIAIAGPLVNLALIAFALLLSTLGIWSKAFADEAIRMNAWIAIFNLLPAMPLDGGRILRAARSRVYGFERATREAYAVGLALAVILVALSGISLWAGYPHLGMLILGIFLFVSAWLGRRDLRLELMRFLDAKKRRRQHTVDEVRAFAVVPTVTVRDVVTRFGPDRYHLVYIVNDKGDVERILHEDTLLDSVFAGDWLKQIGEID